MPAARSRCSDSRSKARPSPDLAIAAPGAKHSDPGFGTACIAIALVVNLGITKAGIGAIIGNGEQVEFGAVVFVGVEVVLQPFDREGVVVVVSIND
ncbi:MAG: hypothetical protein HC876_04625 [Chloroflexaceae bacterium]|nr:hypothetical protein [Chloroflexaceae bacterium]